MAEYSSAPTRSGFWQVIIQILVLDAVFSLDSIITSVGMVDHIPVMMLAVVVAMLVMVMAAAPLTSFVERHPTVIILCLGFLMMIGLSLLMDGLGYHIPKGYLYAAICFSVLVEICNQVALRNRRKRISMRDMRESMAMAVLGLLGGGRPGEEEARRDAAALASESDAQPLFEPEERDMVARCDPPERTHGPLHHDPAPPGALAGQRGRLCHGLPFCQREPLALAAGAGPGQGRSAGRDPYRGSGGRDAPGARDGHGASRYGSAAG